MESDSKTRADAAIELLGMIDNDDFRLVNDVIRHDVACGLIAREDELRYKEAVERRVEQSEPQP